MTNPHVSLIDRLEKADGPDRWLDLEIWARLFKDRPFDTIMPQLAFTASVDAALALAKKVQPGWRVENLCEWEATVLRERGAWMCDLVNSQGRPKTRYTAKCSHAPTPAIALCIAILRAHGATNGNV